MAAPPPYWKKKTRPCPFYSQGRCLFSDSCNFVHSVKITAHPTHGQGAQSAHPRQPPPPDYSVALDSKQPISVFSGSDAVMEKRPAMSRSSSIASSGRRRSVRLMSPPRSPRMSGLLSALESVIGPDVIEVEVSESESEEEEDEGRRMSEEDESISEEYPQNDQRQLDTQVASSSSQDQAHPISISPRSSSVLEEQDDSFNDETNASSRSVPSRPQSGSQPVFPPSIESNPIPPAIIADIMPKDSESSSEIELRSHTLSSTHEPSQHATTAEATDALVPHHSLQLTPITDKSPEQPPLSATSLTLSAERPPSTVSSRRQSTLSTFELLTSPFASPAFRIHGGQDVPVSPLFGAFQAGQRLSGIAATSTPRVVPYATDYGSDDLESLDSSRCSSRELSFESSADEVSSESPPTRPATGEDFKDDDDEDIMPSSPQETERPTSEYHRTPVNSVYLSTERVRESQEIPPLPSSMTRTSIEKDRPTSESHRLSMHADHIREALSQEPEDLAVLPPSLTRNSDGSPRRLSEITRPNSVPPSPSRLKAGFSSAEKGKGKEVERSRTSIYDTLLEAIERDSPSLLPLPEQEEAAFSDSEQISEVIALSPEDHSSQLQLDGQAAMLIFSPEMEQSIALDEKEVDSASAQTEEAMLLAVDSHSPLEEDSHLFDAYLDAEEMEQQDGNQSSFDACLDSEAMEQHEINRVVADELKPTLGLDLEVVLGKVEEHGATLLGTLLQQQDSQPFLRPASEEKQDTTADDSDDASEAEISTEDARKEALARLEAAHDDRSYTLEAGLTPAGGQRASVLLDALLQDLSQPSSPLEAVQPSSSSSIARHATSPDVDVDAQQKLASQNSPPKAPRPQSRPQSVYSSKSRPVSMSSIPELTHAKGTESSLASISNLGLSDPLDESPVASGSKGLSRITITRRSVDSLDSPSTQSVDPSPVSTDSGSYQTMDTVISSAPDQTTECVPIPIQHTESGSHDTLLERRAKQSRVEPKPLAIMSPTQELREVFAFGRASSSRSSSTATEQKTVRAGAAVLCEESTSTPSSVCPSPEISSRPSWAELLKKSRTSSKVPFGFRQSLLVESTDPTGQSLSSKLASRFSVHSGNSAQLAQLGRGSRLSVANRPRSVSPAALKFDAGPTPGPSFDRTLTHRNSTSALRDQLTAVDRPQPLSASRLDFTEKSNSAGQATTPRRQSWMKPLRLSHAGSTASLQSRSSLSPTKLPGMSSARSSVSDVKRYSLINNALQSSSNRSSIISAYLNDNDTPNGSPSTPSHESTGSPDPPSISAQPSFEVTSHSEHRHSFSIGTVDQDTTSNVDLLSPLSGSMRGLEFEELERFRWQSGGSRASLLVPTIAELISPDVIPEEDDEVKQLQMPTPPASAGIEPPVFRQALEPQHVDPTIPTSVQSESSSNEVHPSDTRSSTEDISNSRRVSLRVPPTTLSSTAKPPHTHSATTPRPTLMFAIASDDPEEVERVLASGEAHPNDDIGPQSALEFALTNEALSNRTDIVKTLLAYGADPSVLPKNKTEDEVKEVDIERSIPSQPEEHTLDEVEIEEERDVLSSLPNEQGSMSVDRRHSSISGNKRSKRESIMNPAMKYYLNRAANGPQGKQLQRSDFRALARMRFDFVGQDRALEHLYWVLGMHSQQPIGTPLVVLCCGPCGHGKSLLARKFGSLLDVPTHTVNMTILKTSHDLWQCPSISPYDPPSQRTLAEFLEENAGRRCIVVLDEIDKNEDERTLWSLLAPWELGRCSIDAGRKHIDVRNVIWIGTSNIGQNLVFTHRASRPKPEQDNVLTKPEYRELMNELRPMVTEKLGTSLMSRVTCVLPFVPFTSEECLAIASEAILALGGEEASALEPEAFEELAMKAVNEYVETDGARSLYRSVSTHLMEMF